MKQTSQEKDAERKEKDENLNKFKESFNIAFGHIPTCRRTKNGRQFMFDEGLDTQFIVDICLVGRYAHLLNSEGKQAIQHRFFKH